jgi:hypothetical protein
VLTAVANFWFDKLGHIVPNQLTGIDPESVVAENEKREQVRGRAPRRQAPQAAADRSRGPRLRDRLGLEGLPADRRHLRHRCRPG